MLDEWDNADLAELMQIRNFMVDFRLTDRGELELQEFGEGVLDEIWERAYPVLSQARLDAELTPSGEEMIRSAVKAEKQRLSGKKKRKLADTELGKTLQGQMGAPAALANRYVRQAATEMLKKSPGSGRKQ